MLRRFADLRYWGTWNLAVPGRHVYGVSRE